MFAVCKVYLPLRYLSYMHSSKNICHIDEKKKRKKERVDERKRRELGELATQRENNKDKEPNGVWRVEDM